MDELNFIEKLKKPYPTSRDFIEGAYTQEDEFHAFGWNDCIDSLAKQGHLQTLEPVSVERLRELCTEHLEYRQDVHAAKEAIIICDAIDRLAAQGHLRTALEPEGKNDE